jgi:hypothetical protein
MRKFLLALFLLAAVVVGAWRIFAPAPVTKNPIDRFKAPSPMETVRVAKSATPPLAPVVRAAPEAPNNKMSAKRAQMEERFTDLKEEGKRIRETLIANDPKAAQAYSNISRRPEYREILDQRHQIEANWEKAPDNEREAMLTQMNALRQQGIGMLLSEIQNMSSQPVAAPAAASASQNAPASGAAPAPAPAAPVVFQ